MPPPPVPFNEPPPHHHRQPAHPQDHFRCLGGRQQRRVLDLEGLEDAQLRSRGGAAGAAQAVRGSGGGSSCEGQWRQLRLC